MCILESLFHVTLFTNYAFTLLQDSNTPLHLAFDCGHLEVIEVLASCGADIHLKNKVGVTSHWSVVTFQALIMRIHVMGLHDFILRLY